MEARETMQRIREQSSIDIEASKVSQTRKHMAGGEMGAGQPARNEVEPSRKPEGGGVEIETLQTSKHKLNVWGGGWGFKAKGTKNGEPEGR